MTQPTRLTIRWPDDWHVHLRDGDMLNTVTPYTAEHFGRAIVMPNLVPPVVTGADAAAYRQRVEAAVKPGQQFEPLMTLYLTEGTDPDDLAAAAEQGVIKGVKLYPAGATTNSDSGVRDINRAMPALERMAEIGLPLLVHGEVTDPEVDIFDREAVFIEQVMLPLRERLPELRVVFEHLTTADGVDFVRNAEGAVAATITPHHLMLNRNSLFVGGIRPHNYCLPVVKRERHRLALREAACSGNERFFLGTDSAPHIDPRKESACGCAGIFNVMNTMSCVAQVFEQEGALDKLEAFTSLNGPRFYGLPVHERTMVLERQDEPVSYPAKIDTPDGPLTVFDPGLGLHWRVVSE
ncbi:MAG: dihydroorotase [Gammaproteobacteria bacterium]